MRDRRIGELLMERGLVNAEQVDRALELQQTGGDCRLGSILVSQGAIAEDHLLSFLSMYFDAPKVDLKRTIPDRQAIELFDRTRVEDMRALPVHLMEDPDGEMTLTLAMIDPTDNDVLRHVETETRMRVQPRVASWGGFREALSRFYGASVLEMETAARSTRSLILGLAEALIASGALDREDWLGRAARHDENGAGNLCDSGDVQMRRTHDGGKT
ncbi:MAG: hypothetical protein H6684_00450 [Deltaproteobacteria bacterium]|nr:hypothetical protein [bacterium]MCB9476042.1 hypothetical protein [Deltaproteobacteria bacterium]MCB9478269.1 hypothetical protein [Deltaproteobacteria bacterium]MCB9487179.1 hypothetical protein [Deltaproteobacteria bacterium]